MDFLRVDVSTNLVHVGLAHRERPVSTLPRKIRDPGTVGLHPLRAPLLDLFDDLLEGMISGEGEQRVHVVVSAADGERWTIPVLVDACLVAEERVTVSSLEPSAPSLGAEDQV